MSKDAKKDEGIEQQANGAGNTARQHRTTIRASTVGGSSRRAPPVLPARRSPPAASGPPLRAEGRAARVVGGGNGGGAAGGRKRPNFLFFCVDEMRSPVPYESRQLLAWRQQFLRAQNELMATGVSLTKHSISSVACVPSRTSIFTGQYPSLHGCTATDGGGKAAIEEDMFWLQPNTLPTMGNYFREAGYRTIYKGKWHVSEASLTAPGNHHGPVETFDKFRRPHPVARRTSTFRRTSSVSSASTAGSGPNRTRAMRRTSVG